jgi:hypothetical protein
MYTLLLSEQYNIILKITLSYILIDCMLFGNIPLYAVWQYSFVCCLAVHSSKSWLYLAVEILSESSGVMLIHIGSFFV